MSFQQSYYTSCEVGLRGGKGFQFNATTAGMDSALLAQVERLGLYLPPVSLPSRPTPEQVNDFPTALLYQQLGDGRVVLAQARYTGMDYSGRFGNYFTHALVSDDPLADIVAQKFLPIELWQSEDWVETQTDTIELPLCDHMHASEHISPQAVRKFLADGNRISHLPQFLTAVERALNGDRRVIIVDDDTNVALWIAAVSYALPPRLALRLTFNTYAKNPYQTEFVITGTTSDSDFRFAAHELDYQFFVFDFIEGRFSSLQDKTGFAINASSLYAQGSANRLADFGRFIEQNALAPTLAELDSALACYMLALGLTPLHLERTGAIRWLARCLDAFDPERVEAVLAGVLAGQDLNEDVIEVSTDLYLAARDPRVRKMIEPAYLQALVKEIAANDTLLQRVLARLPQLDQEGQQVAQPLRKSWLKLLNDTGDSRHIQSLLRLGQKCGYLDDDKAFEKVGRENLAPVLLHTPIHQALQELSVTPAYPFILNGIGAGLTKKIKDVNYFHSLSRLLSIPVIGDGLEQYAIENHHPNLYVRLLIARTGNQLQQPMLTFQRFLAELQRSGGSIKPEELNDAFSVIWQGYLPNEQDCLELLRLLSPDDVVASKILLSIADFATGINPAHLDRLSPAHRQLIRMLEEPRFWDHLDDNRKLAINAGVCGVILGESLEMEKADDKELEWTLRLLRDNGKRIFQATRMKLYHLVATCLPYSQSLDKQYQLLLQGFDDVGAGFVALYGDAIVRPPQQPSAIHYDVLANFFVERVAPDLPKIIGKPKKTAKPESVKAMADALYHWEPKECKEIGKRLDKEALGLWNDWRGISGSLIQRLFGGK